MASKFAGPAKAAVSALLAGAVLMTAMPASAQYRDRRGDNDRIDAGDIIAGAVIIGGLAAILSAGSNRDRGYDPRYDRGYDPRSDRDYGGYDRNGYGGQWRQYGSRQAVQQCVVAAEQRAGYYGARADVRQITQVERVRGGYQVRGTIALEDRYGRDDRYNQRGGYNRGDRYEQNDRYDRDDRDDHDDRYDRYDRDDRRGYDNQGRFSCTVRYGHIQNIRVNGIG